MAKLPDTSGSVIEMVFLVMNLEKLLRKAFLRFFHTWLFLTHGLVLLVFSWPSDDKDSLWLVSAVHGA
jgi:hypothetical protein